MEEDPVVKLNLSMSSDFVLILLSILSCRPTSISDLMCLCRGFEVFTESRGEKTAELTSTVEVATMVDRVVLSNSFAE